MEAPLLTPREQQVLDLVKRGYTNRGIAEELGISLATVRYHVSEIISKLGVTTRDEAAHWRPQRAFALAFLTRELKPPSWEVIMKATTAAVLGAGVLVIVAIAAGVLLMQSRSGSSASPPDQTDRLRIPALELDAEIEVLLVPPQPKYILRSFSGELLWPQDAAKVAAYDFTLVRQSVFSPAGIHNTVIAAGPGTDAAPSLFAKLPSLSPGHSIDLTLGGRSQTYTVVSVCQVARTGGAPMLYGTPAEALTLITEEPHAEGGFVYVQAELEPGSLGRACPTSGTNAQAPTASYLAERIRIPALGLDSGLEVLEVQPGSAMPSPSGPGNIAVYDFTLVVSNSGFRYGPTNTIIAARRGTSLQQGPFYSLDSLQLGDRVDLIRDGEFRRYTVLATCEVGVDDFGGVVADTYLAAGTYFESLTLITDHPLDPDKRLYVRADLDDEWRMPSRCPAGTPYIFPE